MGGGGGRVMLRMSCSLVLFWVTLGVHLNIPCSIFRERILGAGGLFMCYFVSDQGRPVDNCGCVGKALFIV